MTTSDWRKTTWHALPTTDWDIVIVGGGITGAGILREAARAGLTALLVEQKDFAWGTSSRSSKLVHGGLRYLKTGQIGLTLESVRERESLLEDGPGLIDPLGFLIATQKGDKPGRFAYGAGLAIYDLMALQWSHRYYTPDDFRMLAPHIKDQNLRGGFRYDDAQTDDARLTLRVIQEAVAAGGTAINYARAVDLTRDDSGHVSGVIVRDLETDTNATISAKAVVNATGAWADHLRGKLGEAPSMRPLRGSHLVFPAWRVPIAQAVTFLHPVDRRPVFAFPWEGATLIGTTDIDHDDDLNAEPTISPDEVAYLMAAACDQFPALNLSLDDIIATWAGVRPVVGSGQEDPSKESRDYVIWQENGLLTVTGGKLTTFRAVALAALRSLKETLPQVNALSKENPVLDAVDPHLLDDCPLSDPIRQRLIGRYGAMARDVVALAQPDDLTRIPGTYTLWAELRWAAASEHVVHLEDLLLRRTRLGLLMKGGGLTFIDRVRDLCQESLGWDDARWQSEVAAYDALWHAHYFLPDRAAIPDWQAQIDAQRRTVTQPVATNKRTPMPWIIGVFVAWLAWRWLRSPRHHPLSE